MNSMITIANSLRRFFLLGALCTGLSAELEGQWIVRSIPEVSSPTSRSVQSVQLLEAPRSSAGLVYSGVGALGGTLVGLPFAAAIGMQSTCAERGETLGCFTPIIPLLLGATIGASGGALLAGDAPAWGRTLLGSLVGGVVSILIVSGDEPMGVVTVPILLSGPAIGAVIGNRLGQ
jgi:hypothetical protein